MSVRDDQLDTLKVGGKDYDFTVSRICRASIISRIR